MAPTQNPHVSDRQSERAGDYVSAARDTFGHDTADPGEARAGTEMMGALLLCAFGALLLAMCVKLIFF